MKKVFVAFTMISFVCFYAGLFADQAIANKAGAPPGTTGAPGEDNCTKCHSGTVNSGSGNIAVDFNSGGTSYDINNTYTINVVIGGSAATNGFSIVALDENGSNAGSVNITNSANTMTASLNGKTYVSHKDANTEITDSWQFEWVAPGVGAGPVTFYAAGNASNGGNNNSGDKIYTSSTTITGPGVGIDKIQSGINIEVYPTLFEKDIHIRGLENKDAIISVYQINGALAHKSKLDRKEETVLDLSGLNKGIYIIYINDGKTIYTNKVFKNS